MWNGLLHYNFSCFLVKTPFSDLLLHQIIEKSASCKLYSYSCLLQCFIKPPFCHLFLYQTIILSLVSSLTKAFAIIITLPINIGSYNMPLNWKIAFLLKQYRLASPFIKQSERSLVLVAYLNMRFSRYLFSSSYHELLLNRHFQGKYRSYWASIDNKVSAVNFYRLWDDA